MAYSLFDNKPLSEPMLTYCQLDPKNEDISKKFHFKFRVFIQENAFENIVRKMEAILSRSQYIWKPLW